MSGPLVRPVELLWRNVYLRLPIDADAADALLMFRDPDIALWYPAPAVVDLQSAQEWCRRGADWSEGDHATFTIVDQDKGRLVGNISLMNIDLVDQRSASIAYRTAPWARRQGVASDAVEAVTKWAFDTLTIERIRLEHSVSNAASCGVAGRCTYLLEGVMRLGHRDERGVRHDTHLHARLAPESSSTTMSSRAGLPEVPRCSSTGKPSESMTSTNASMLSGFCRCSASARTSRPLIALLW